MSETATYELSWQDYYRFDVLRNGELYLAGCPSRMYGMVCTGFRVVVANARPRPTLSGWFKALLRSIVDE